MSRDAFGFERDDSGFEELVECECGLRHPPSFCWTLDEHRDWLAGYVTESELRAKHDLILKRRERQIAIECGLPADEARMRAADRRSEWAEYGWLPGADHERRHE